MENDVKALLMEAYQAMGSAQFWLISKTTEGNKSLQQLRKLIPKIEDCLRINPEDRLVMSEKGIGWLANMDQQIKDRNEADEIAEKWNR